MRAPWQAAGKAREIFVDIFYRALMWGLSLLALVSSLCALIMLTKILVSYRKNLELLTDKIRKVFLKPVILMCVGAVSAFAAIALYINILL